jgi:N-acetylglutamate synthase-like GNAT family acetyltransferase
VIKEVQAVGELAQQLEDRLYAFNQEATGHWGGADLAFAVEEDGVLVAGLSGYVWGGIAEVKQLWVREDRRGHGLGLALLNRAIAAARAHGCRFLFLSTHSFQAPAFYEGLGFERIATIADKPLGHAEHWMRLAL